MKFNILYYFIFIYAFVQIKPFHVVIIQKVVSKDNFRINSKSVQVKLLRIKEGTKKGDTFKK